ncbi:hypothetical protein DFP73DRAFT_523802 [Morchella snyderi]|nr:hypothetical protein DFP73DRAFT_523802 [Morchella snyderi]
MLVGQSWRNLCLWKVPINSAWGGGGQSGSGSSDNYLVIPYSANTCQYFHSLVAITRLRRTSVKAPGKIVGINVQARYSIYYNGGLHKLCGDRGRHLQLWGSRKIEHRSRGMILHNMRISKQFRISDWDGDTALPDGFIDYVWLSSVSFSRIRECDYPKPPGTPTQSDHDRSTYSNANGCESSGLGLAVAGTLRKHQTYMPDIHPVQGQEQPIEPVFRRIL